MTLLDVPPRAPATAVSGATTDEAAARRLLRAQISRLESRLSSAVVDSMPDGGIDTGRPGAARPARPQPR